MSSPDFSQTWINKSKDGFTLQEQHVNLSSIESTDNASPDKVLDSGKQTTLSWSQKLSAIVNIGFEGYVIWRAKNGHNFGVKIRVPAQDFGIGQAPYYSIMYDDGYWGHEYTSDIFGFPESMGYRIVVTPQAAHSSLRLTITISDL